MTGRSGHDNRESCLEFHRRDYKPEVLTLFCSITQGDGGFKDEADLIGGVISHYHARGSFYRHGDTRLAGDSLTLVPLQRNGIDHCPRTIETDFQETADVLVLKDIVR